MEVLGVVGAYMLYYNMDTNQGNVINLHPDLSNRDNAIRTFDCLPLSGRFLVGIAFVFPAGFLNRKLIT